MSATDIKKLQKAVSGFREANILVIGDIIVDHFIWGSVSRISPEAPVPVVNVTDENLLLGGAANVLHNIYALGAQASLCGVVGNDAMGDHLLGLLTDLSSPTSGVVRTNDRPTTLKTRIVAQGQQVVRFDREKTGEPSEASIHGMLDFIDNNLESFDAVIVSDYSKGVISPAFMDRLRQGLSSKPYIPVVVDPKPHQPERFRGATIMTPNHHEAQTMAGMAITDEESLVAAAAKLKADLGCEAMLITRGEAGMSLLEDDKPVFTIPTVAKEVYDVTGAGDTVAATLTLGLAAGLSFAGAATLANHAAGIVVGKVGTATATTDELLAVIS